MSPHTYTYAEVAELLKESMKHQLDLAEACLPWQQYKAFRKLTLDYLADLQKFLGTDRCGRKQYDGEGGGVMGG